MPLGFYISPLASKPMGARGCPVCKAAGSRAAVLPDVGPQVLLSGFLPLREPSTLKVPTEPHRAPRTAL